MLNNINISFLSEPIIDYNLTGLLNLLELPVIYSQLQNAISKTIKKKLLFPQKMTIPIKFKSSDNFKTQRIRVLILEFEHLLLNNNSDSHLYGQITFLNQQYSIILNNKLSKENHSNQIVLFLDTFKTTNTDLEIEIYKDEAFKIDKKLLNTEINLSNCFNNNVNFQNFQLDNDKNISTNSNPVIKLNFTWLQLADKYNNNFDINKNYSVITIKLYYLTQLFIGKLINESPEICLKIKYGDKNYEIDNINLNKYSYSNSKTQLYKVTDFLINYSDKIITTINFILYDKNNNVTIGVKNLTIFDQNNKFILQNQNKVVLYTPEYHECNLYLSILHSNVIKTLEYNDNETTIDPIEFKTTKKQVLPIPNDNKDIDNELNIPTILLYIDIYEAKNIKIKDKFVYNSSDPYIVLKHDNVAYKTSVKNQTLAPVWNEKFSFLLNSYNLSNDLNITMYDHDNITTDDIIASTNISINKKLQDNKSILESKWHLLSEDSGEIKIGLRSLFLSPITNFETIFKTKFETSASFSSEYDEKCKNMSNIDICVGFYVKNLTFINKKKKKNDYYLEFEYKPDLETNNTSKLDEINHTMFEPIYISKTKSTSIKDNNLNFNQWCHLVGKTKDLTEINLTLFSKNHNNKGSTNINLNNLFVSNDTEFKEHNNVLNMNQKNSYIYKNIEKTLLFENEPVFKVYLSIFVFLLTSN